MDQPIKNFFSHALTWVVISSFSFAIEAIVLVHGDKEFTYRWFELLLYLLSIAIPVVFFIFQTIKSHHLQRAIHERNLLLFTTLTVIAEVVCFFSLSTYPLVSLGDEVRDGGMDVVKIATGQLTNVFDYGRYDAHGLIIPTLGVPFYFLFGHTVGTFRIYAAVLSVLDIIILFFLLRRYVDSLLSFLGSITLLSFPLHLFFSRTQVVVIWNSLWTSVLLLVFSLFLDKRRVIDYITLGTLLGFASTFHAGVRVVAILLLLIVLMYEVIDCMRYDKAGQDILIRLGKSILLLIFAVIGFGPKLLFTTPQIFFHTTRLQLAKDNVQGFFAIYSQLEHNYLKSLMGWFYESVKYFYPDAQPLLAPVLAIFFILGIGSAIFLEKKRFTTSLLLLALLIPFFSSAITEAINADHRLSVLLPIGAIFITLGISYLAKGIKNYNIRVGFYLVVMVYLFMQIGHFFLTYPVNKDVPTRDFLSMDVISMLAHQTSPSSAPRDICITTSVDNAQEFTLLQYKEQYQYFLPQDQVTWRGSDKYADSEAVIAQGSCTIPPADEQQTKVFSCSKSAIFCPYRTASAIVLITSSGN
ncbi:MAG TPA: hypothetical protein VG935_01220 [Patescibacteria group bacterium]|nr:hypothetical protein [Patescibacteria group bacterium]